MPEVSAPKSTASSPFWRRILEADYPMYALYQAFSVPDKARRKLALDVVREPELVAQAFQATIDAMCPYDVQDPFRAPTPSVAVDQLDEPTGGPAVNPGELRATKDVALRLRPAGQLTPVDVTAVPGVGHGDLDLVFLEREPTLTRTTKAHRDAGVVEPGVKMKADLLLAAPDGTIGIGEIKVKHDRDLFYALIQALTGIALIATPAQIRRVFANYVTPQFGLPPGFAPKLDVILLTVPRTDGGETYLTQLDVLARGFVPVLLAQPPIAAVIRQVVAIRAALDGEELALTARWVERPGIG